MTGMTGNCRSCLIVEKGKSFSLYIHFSLSPVKPAFLFSIVSAYFISEPAFLCKRITESFQVLRCCKYL